MLIDLNVFQLHNQNEDEFKNKHVHIKACSGISIRDSFQQQDRLREETWKVSRWE